ncbi:MAG: TadE/TadG family type IV pilus assembly protein, partial [Pseudolabrys sp.]
RGASAIEFALIAPLMLGLYIGCVEISEGVADRKVTLTAGTLANLTSQVTTLTTADIGHILNASIAIRSVAAKISCLKIDATGIARVTWGEATTGVTKRAPGEVVTIPANLAVPNSYLVFSEVSYQYVPVTGFSPGFSHISASGITLSDVMYMAPRISPPQYGARKCV